MDAPDRRSRFAVTASLLACMVGWFLLPYTPAALTYLPGDTPGRLGQLQQMFTWWPLALLAAFAIGLWIPRLPANGVLRKALRVLQWLLTFASVLLVIVSLFLVFLPRIGWG
jgi:hypothetical protein